MKAICDLQIIKRKIEVLKSNHALQGSWELFKGTLQLESDLASLSLSIFDPNKIDLIPSPVAKEVRFWRQFSKELKLIKTKTLTSSQPLKLVQSGFNPIALLSIRYAGRWVLRN